MTGRRSTACTRCWRPNRSTRCPSRHYIHPGLGEHLRAGEAASVRAGRGADEAPGRARVYACPANLERLERAAALEERKGSSHRPDRAGAPTHRPRSPGERFADNAGALLISLTAAEPAWLDLETDTLP